MSYERAYGSLMPFKRECVIMKGAIKIIIVISFEDFEGFYLIIFFIS